MWNVSSRRSSAVLCSVLLFAGCRGDSRTPTPLANLSAPSPVPSPPAANVATWRGEAAVLSASSPFGACGWGTSPGETRGDVGWRITIDNSSILLEEDIANWPTDHIPFSGTLNGRQFNATYTNGPNYLLYVCRFKGATLTGSFAEDFSSFEAHETLVWGPPDSETVVQRRWTVSRLQQ